MKDGEYTVRKIEAGKMKVKLILGGVPKTDFIWTSDKRIQKGSIINVRGGKLINVVGY
ncbi:MAG: hypothetical protein HFJ57_05425 [Clostridia bacterium]|nr:hypothetical protein [Clostridia bacterium]